MDIVLKYTFRISITIATCLGFVTIINMFPGEGYLWNIAILSWCISAWALMVRYLLNRQDIKQ